MSLSVAGCAAPAPRTTAEAKPAPRIIYSAARGSFIDRATLEADLAAARYVLLGEKHDNKEHHALQRELLASLLARKRRPALVLEMLEVDVQEKIDQGGSDLASLAPGWDWPLYDPIVALARTHGLSVVAGNYPRAKIKASFHGTPISPEDRATFALDAELPARASLEQELLDGHCGHLPKELLPAFVDAQRLRDGQMAERMIARGKDDGAVLIAGSGHVRNDRGVGWILRTRDKTARVLSLAFIEGPPDVTAAQPYDVVWFTAPAAREDPCAPPK